MQILLATNSYLPQQTPAAEAVDALATELRSAGHHVLVLAPALRGYPSRDEDLIRISMATVRNDPALTDVPIPEPFQPALVHSFGVFGLGAAALAYAARVGAPLVLTDCARYADYPSLTGGLARNLEALFGALETRYAAYAAAVIATDGKTVRDLDRRRVSSHVIQAPLPIGRIWWDEPIQRPGRRPLRSHPEDFLLGLVGRLAPEERTGRNLAALAHFLERSKHARGVILGDGPLTDAARELAARPDLVGRVQMLPPRGRAPLRRVLLELDAVLGVRPGAPLSDWTRFAEAIGVPVLYDGEAPLRAEVLADQALEAQALSPKALARARIERRRRLWEATGPAVIQTYQALYRRLRLQGASAPSEPDERLLGELLAVTPDVRDFWSHLDLRRLPVESIARTPTPTSLLDRKETTPWKPTMPSVPSDSRRMSRRRGEKRASGTRPRDESEERSPVSSPSSISA